MRYAFARLHHGDPVMPTAVSHAPRTDTPIRRISNPLCQHLPCRRQATVRHKRPGARAGWRYACDACFAQLTEHLREPILSEHLSHAEAVALAK